MKYKTCPSCGQRVFTIETCIDCLAWIVSKQRVDDLLELRKKAKSNFTKDNGKLMARRKANKWEATK